MIHVLHWPATGPDGGAALPRAWFAFDTEDLLHKVAGELGCALHEVWDCASVRELLEVCDETPEAPGLAERQPALWALGRAEGWDRPLYRAGHLPSAAGVDCGCYQAQPLSPLLACRAALASLGGQWRIYPGEAEALVAADAPDPLFDAPGGWRARLALRQQLIAVEALADDL